MRIYKWTGPGHDVDATIIVCAENIEVAKSLIFDNLASQMLHSNVEIQNQDISELDTDKETLIYADYGRYH